MSDKENCIIYDWVTFTSKIDSPDSIIDMLGMSDYTFISLDHGFNGYPFCLYYEGISICYGGRDDMGVCCSMSGHGCRTFESCGNGDYTSLFDTIISYYSDDADKRQMSLTRLDVAYDDFDGILDIFTIFKAMTCNGYADNKLLRGAFVSRFTNFDVDISNKGLTCGFGSVQSNIYIRIYDKKAEQHADDVDHWVRVELQLRRSNAIGFAMLTGDIVTNFFGVLNNYLRFIDPSDTDSNVRRAKTADWWSSFLETSHQLHIFSKPGTEYDIYCLDGYVYGQCAGAIYTMIELIGIDCFLERINDVVQSRKLNPKYRALINTMCGDVSLEKS